MTGSLQKVTHDRRMAQTDRGDKPKSSLLFMKEDWGQDLNTENFCLIILEGTSTEYSREKKTHSTVETAMKI